MTTVEIGHFRTASCEETSQTDIAHKIKETASSCVGFVVERFTGSSETLDVDNGVPLFEDRILTYAEKASWFEDRCSEIPFGD